MLTKLLLVGLIAACVYVGRECGRLARVLRIEEHG